MTGAVSLYKSVIEMPFTFERDVGGNMCSVCKSYSGDSSPVGMQTAEFHAETFCQLKLVTVWLY
jgi:hypothetical protein